MALLAVMAANVVAPRTHPAPARMARRERTSEQTSSNFFIGISLFSGCLQQFKTTGEWSGIALRWIKLGVTESNSLVQ
jgi:uncharacterized membrane protein YgdD (TMEM256/DUF423 family)